MAGLPGDEEQVLDLGALFGVARQVTGSFGRKLLPASQGHYTFFQ
jgi:hypothetical protein